MSEIRITLHPLEIEALNRGASLLVRPWQRQPEKDEHGWWYWQPSESVSRRLYFDGHLNDYRITRDLFCPFGKPGDVLVVHRRHVDPTGRPLIGTVEDRLTVTSVEVRMLHSLADRFVTTMWNTVHPNHPYASNPHVWLAGVE